MATPLTNAPSRLSRDAEVALGTLAAPGGPGQAVVAATVYSYVPKKANKTVILFSPNVAGTMTLAAGVYPPALASGSVGAGASYTTAQIAAGALAVIVADPSKHMQADGSFQISFSQAGVVWVFEAAF